VYSSPNFVAVAEPPAAATCLGLASIPVSNGFEVIGKNTAACSGRAGNVSVYVALQWQLPREGGWVEIARNRTTTKVGEKRSITVSAACNGNTQQRVPHARVDLPQRHPEEQLTDRPTDSSLRPPTPLRPWRHGGKGADAGQSHPDWRLITTRGQVGVATLLLSPDRLG
jgi:hypothetical protein